LGPFMLPASPLIRTIFLFSPKFEIRQSYSWLSKENETSLKLKRILCYSVKQFCMHCLDFWFFFLIDSILLHRKTYLGFVVCVLWLCIWYS
jgi:hypothetical protein